MRFEKSIAAAFAMSEEVWARHANPWSVWTRYATFPMLILSIWSRVWFGWWALIPIFLTLVWLWLNPRGFEKPSSTDNWASKAVLGERIWMARQNITLPHHHRRIPVILATTATVGLIFLLWGLIVLSVWPTLVRRLLDPVIQALVQ